MEINKTNQINFEGIKKMSKEKIPFEKQIEEMVEKLLQKAESHNVPEYGRFEQVFERVKNPNKGGQATDFVLVIKQPNDSKPTYRVLDAAAYKLPTAYKYEHTIAAGTKQEIIKAMQEEGFAQKVKETFERLSSHFE